MAWFGPGWVVRPRAVRVLSGYPEHRRPRRNRPPEVVGDGANWCEEGQGSSNERTDHENVVCRGAISRSPVRGGWWVAGGGGGEPFFGRIDLEVRW